MNKAICPVCNSDVIIDEEAVQGDLVTCANCEKDLEIITLHPPKLRELED